MKFWHRLGVRRTMKGFRWRTADGRIFTLKQMETRHLFNSLKMVFNHVAYRYDLGPVWPGKVYPVYKNQAEFKPEKLARLVVVFLAELEKRKMPDDLKRPYELILKQVESKREILEDAMTEALSETSRDRNLREFGIHIDFMGCTETSGIGAFQELPNFGVFDDDILYESEDEHW